MRQVLAMQTLAIQRQLPPEHLKITKGTGKLCGMCSLNTNTTTNAFCIAMHNSPDERVICKTCYSMRMLRTCRKNCAPAWQHNSDQLEFELQDWQLPRLNELYFRFDSHGELLNETHFLNLLRICEVNPKTTFALYTKRHKLVIRALEKHSLPDNLILVYSNPFKDRVTGHKPKHFHKVFNTTTERHSSDNCSGRTCIECLNCYDKTKDATLVELEK
jgi:hypothetical protein